MSILSPAQRTRLQRVYLAGAVYFFSWLLSLIFYQLQLVRMPFWVLLALGPALFLIAAAFRFWIVSGRNLRFTDPSMTAAQLVVASCWSFVPIFYNPPLRGEMLMVHVSMYFFGCFRLRRRQFLQVSIWPLMLYLLMIVADHQLHPQVDVLRELFRFVLFAATLLIISFIGGDIFEMRRNLRLKQKELQHANELISKQASHDALTGIYNRRYLIDAMAREEARTKRRGGRFSVIICDLDHFKNVNDRFGHLMGDQVLQTCARAIAEQLRAEDSVAIHSDNTSNDGVVARYGGEEFVLLLPDTDSEGAQICAERLRHAVQQLRFTNLPPDQQVTASFGVAAFRPGDVSKDVLARADSALYEAKHAGRNRVVVAH
jgi:diguanylate cyclase (GGDEF)-like protein